MIGCLLANNNNNKTVRLTCNASPGIAVADLGSSFGGEFDL
jgi:hypothetical protein